MNIPAEVSAIEVGLVQDALIRMVVSWRELAETLPLADDGPSRTFCLTEERGLAREVKRRGEEVC